MILFRSGRYECFPGWLPLERNREKPRLSRSPCWSLRTARSCAHPEFPGYPCIAVGHEGRRLFMLGADVAYLRGSVNHVQEIEDGTSDDPKDKFHPSAFRQSTMISAPLFSFLLSIISALSLPMYYPPRKPGFSRASRVIMTSMIYGLSLFNPVFTASFSSSNRSTWAPSALKRRAISPKGGLS